MARKPPPIRVKKLLLPYSCRHCGATGHGYPSERKVYCSASCRSKYTKHRSRNPQSGSRLSDSHRIKLSISHIGVQSGSNHPRWKGGTKTERSMLMQRYEYKAWRSSVFKRDDFTCQRCKVRGGYIMAHHVKPWSKFPELRYDINNGVTLCKTCHAIEDPMFSRFCKTGD